LSAVWVSEFLPGEQSMTIALPNKHNCNNIYGIGIDTGGTYTDSVIVELSSGTVASKAKALTSHGHLGTGIENSLSQLDQKLFRQVGLVALSTTLATNSVVEGKGARVGLFMAVPNPQTFQLPAALPCEQVAVISGAHNHRGEMTVPLAADATDQIERLAHEIDAYAVSSYYSIYNAEHEIALRKLISELTGKPTICAHELSGKVGMVERATTAVLNARLLPVIRELLGAVEEILIKMDIHAPLMVVKGDGSMMSSDACRSRPVETILSGPAASISGACRLSGIKDALVLDMGGTTTDIAVVKEGRAKVSDEGARVGSWLTRVQAVDMWTLGLGGDSQLRTEPGGRLHIGPGRVVPLSLAGTTCKDLSTHLELLLEMPPGQLTPEHYTYFTLHKKNAVSLSALERQLLSELEGKVLSLHDIRQRISPFVETEKLLKLGLIIEVGFTPTDLLHCTGQCTVWDRSAAEAGLQLLARQAGLTGEEMKKTIRCELNVALAGGIVAKALQEDPGIASVWNNSLHSLLESLLRLDGKLPISVNFPLQLVLVAVGAPAHAYLPSVAEKLSCRLVIPPHAEVANAYGAVTGKVVETASAIIRPATPDGYIVISLDQRQRVLHLREALQLARQQAEARARKIVTERGGEDIQVEIYQDEIRAPLEAGWGDSVLIELRIMATASGSPALHRQQEHMPSAAIPPTDCVCHLIAQ
jgi:N-methylhydantoinase A/oxoprolinase/acetone carboxylase beta subunit